MESVVSLVGGLDWHEVGRVFLIMSAIGFVASCLVNQYLKKLPVLAVQLSILVTLTIFPLINLYLLMGSGYELFDDTLNRANPADYGALVFLGPLPVCVFTSAVFFAFRNKGKDEKTLRQVNKTKLITKIAPSLISLTMGGLWLSMGMIYEKGNFHTTVALFIFYTVLGFIMYVASEGVLLIVRQLIGKSGGTEAGS